MQKWYDCTGEEKGPECFSPRHPSARENGFSATPFSDCLIFYSEWSHRNSHSFEVAIITADIAASTATVLQTNRSRKEQSLEMRKQPKGKKKMCLRWGGRKNRQRRRRTKKLKQNKVSKRYLYERRYQSSLSTEGNRHTALNGDVRQQTTLHEWQSD